MQLKNHNFCFLVLMTACFLFACNDADDTTEIKANDTTTSVTSDANTNTTSMPPYDAALDPLTVEAAFIKKLGDTLNVKMYELTVKPGDSAALHTHPDFTMYVLQGGKLAITPQGADRQELDLKAGMGVIFGSVTHSGKNIGNTTVKLLITDIYRPRGK